MMRSSAKTLLCRQPFKVVHTSAAARLGRNNFGAASMSSTAAHNNDTFLPRRHSRHGPPPTCLDPAQLEELTGKLLEAKPGALYTYDVLMASSTTRGNKSDNIDMEKDRTHAWDIANGVVQQTEFVMRGHAALLPDTICWNQQEGQIEDQSDVAPEERVETLKSLVQRLEQEGQLYMKLREEVRQTENLVEEENNDTAESSGIDGQQQELRLLDAQEQAHDADDITENGQDFASPGPTIAMYDVLLDCMAIVPSSQTPNSVGTVLETVMERHYQDVGQEDNKKLLSVNPYTVPTILTFNALLRAIANTPYNEQEETRDDALYYAFGTYDGMRDVVERNAATYEYMLQVVSKYFPPSKTRGNIANALWMQARKEHVVNDLVVKALQLANTPSNGQEHDAWLAKHDMHQRDNSKDEAVTIPLKFRRNARLRRHDKRYATY